MLKEIHEQGTAVGETLSHWRATGAAPGAICPLERLSTVDRIVIVGAALLSRRARRSLEAIERWARVPVEVEAAWSSATGSIIGQGTLVLAITQSGETADTLAAMRLARERGRDRRGGDERRRQPGDRDSDGVLLTRAGPEMVSRQRTRLSLRSCSSCWRSRPRRRPPRADAPEEVAELQAALDLLPVLTDETVA